MKLSAKISFLWVFVPCSMSFQPSVHQHTTIHTTKTALLNHQRSTNDDTRRDLFVRTTTAATAAATFWFGSATKPSLVQAASPSSGGDNTDYGSVAKDIMAMVQADPSRGPTLVRLAWHSSGTYDKMKKDGGSGLGTIRFREELAHGGNAGLATTAVQWMEEIHQNHPTISYADLYTLGGVAAIKAMGGPVIPWRAGRVDALTPDAVTPDGRLPNADSGPQGADPSDADHLRMIFYRMGFDDQEIVALSGAHALGRCHPNASGYDGPWTPTPTTFNNAYFTLLKNLNWIPKTWSGPYQYVDAPTGKLMMLPTDLVLLQDPKFAKWVDVYAKDGTKFNQDFTKAFQKLEELGTSNLKRVEWA